MAVVYFSLGTNIGDKRNNMITAVALLSERVGNVLALSDLYETTPWGFLSENNFLNAALMMETTLSPCEILAITQEIERVMGRTQKSDGEYHDRVIDIDILLYDDWVIDTPLLTLPHPLMHQRSFVLGPLSEIAHTCIHPVLKRSIGELYMALPTNNTQANS
ncbi:2-amino-4-hydroxy-6-hydroxymethyldihydropteridine diphosphokinase [Macellibacteroides fermentans]|uniref:2-amino-4-hydroxy-6- hydroxymethyldihydropteridine diphosphokinase n=1 Tax=Macellibacteroides fermentans TaxID=879969 RepID=UPI00406C968D